MARVVRVAVSQASFTGSTDAPLEEIRQGMVGKHEVMIRDAATAGVNVMALQSLFSAPYFCATQDPRWYRFAERVPEGPTCQRMKELAAELGMVLVVPVFEVSMTGLYYNTAAVFDADGSYKGKYRKTHIPHSHPGYWEKYYFKPGDLGYPVFPTLYGRVGVLLGYDRHFPEGARALGLGGGEIIFVPCATVSAETSWEVEQRSHAIANGYFVATSNRVGVEVPWEIGEFFGTSYICDPRGKLQARASRDQDEVVFADCDLELIQEVRDQWQFFRDRRPEMYGVCVEQEPWGNAVVDGESARIADSVGSVSIGVPVDRPVEMTPASGAVAVPVASESQGIPMVVMEPGPPPPATESQAFPAVNVESPDAPSPIAAQSPDSPRAAATADIPDNRGD